MNRLLANDEYKDFFAVDKSAKRITINNNFKGEAGKENPFVRLSTYEIHALEQYNDSLLYRYYIYIKYFCGYSKEKKTDFTAKQFLSACGYSTVSSYIQKVSQYNSILKKAGMVDIKSFTDEKGHKRNIYSIRSLV